MEKVVYNNFKRIVIIALAIAISLSFASVSKATTKTYDSNVNNYLDNLSKDENELIIPIVLNSSDDSVTLSKIQSDFTSKGYTINSISSNIIGTGTVITATKNEVTFTYKILIYGDVNGDGRVNLIDAQRVIIHKIQPALNQLSGIYLKAANTANSDGTDTINLIDAQRIIIFKISTGSNAQSLMAVAPTLTVADTEKPVITLNGNGEETVVCYSTYNDPGATAMDNMDGDITSQIIKTGSVDTNTLGTYTIKYNVTDENGNVANEVVRTVNVVKGDLVFTSMSLQEIEDNDLRIGNAINRTITAYDQYPGTDKGEMSIPANKLLITKSDNLSVTMYSSDNELLNGTEEDKYVSYIQIASVDPETNGYDATLKLDIYGTTVTTGEISFEIGTAPKLAGVSFTQTQITFDGAVGYIDLPLTFIDQYNETINITPSNVLLYETGYEIGDIILEIPQVSIKEKNSNIVIGPARLFNAEYRSEGNVLAHDSTNPLDTIRLRLNTNPAYDLDTSSVSSGTSITIKYKTSTTETTFTTQTINLLFTNID